MAERYLATTGSEVEFTKKHIASLSGVPGGVTYPADFSLPAQERERKVAIAQIPLVQPPEPSTSASSSAGADGTASTSTAGSSSDTVSITVKSLKPPLSFTLPCSLTASIADLKASLYASSRDKGAPEPERQRWLFKGKAMADERLLKEYDGIKDGDTVHLSIKAGAAAPAAAEPAAPAASAAMDVDSSELSKEKDHVSPLPSPFNFGSSTKSRSDSLSAPLSPGAMGPPRSRTTSSSSKKHSHARVPSITLTTDFSNFNNLSGSATSPIDGNQNPGNVPAASPIHSRSPSLGGGRYSPDPFAVAVGSPTAAGVRSGDSTPLSTPGTPMSGIVGYGRTRAPSITVPLDLDDIDMINPISSDRKHPIGLSPAFLATMRDTKTWSDLLNFIEAKFKPEQRPGTPSRDGDNYYSEETKRIFETWLAASKDWLNASDIAKIRDQTGVWGMGGR